MLKSVKAHPGVFIAGAVTYAFVAHFILPKYGHTVMQKMPTGR